MKIFFYANDRSLDMGSYRIWVDNLNHYFRKCGIESTISDNHNQINGYDVVICNKADAGSATRIKKDFPDKKVGVINLNSDKIQLRIDFCIVGSLEEMDSMSGYKNVFLYPLIEKMYQSGSYKAHSRRKVLRVGFHGHYPHLSKFEPHLKGALEKFNKSNNVELLVITGNPEYSWSRGRPNINIINKRWGLKTIKNDLLSCDIGVVPNATSLKEKDLSGEYGLYNTDYAIRFKNKSNAGRCFVFHQLGIPVIADFTPSNFHILGDPRNGFIAHNRGGWLKALVKLKDHKLRQEIAGNAKKEFDRLYDPKDWAMRLYENILKI